MASGRIVLRSFQRNSSIFRSSRVLGCFSSHKICGNSTKVNAIALPKLGKAQVTSRYYTTNTQDPGLDDGIAFKQILLSQIDKDFINASGIVMNDMDEAITFALGNQKMRELWGGCRDEDEALLIRMSSGNMSSLFLLDNLSDEQDFWIKYCSSSQDNTIFPHVNKFDNTPYLPYATNINSRDLKKHDMLQYFPVDKDVVWQLYGMKGTDATINAGKFGYENVRRKAGIYYKSSVDFPDAFIDDGNYEGYIPKTIDRGV